MTTRQYTEVKTYICEEKKMAVATPYLVIEKPDGTIYSVDIFSGGGYVEQLTFNEMERPQEVSDPNKATQPLKGDDK